MAAYHFKIKKWPDGFTAECIEIEGCKTEGDTMEELKENMKEVLDLCLDETPDSKLMFGEPKQFKKFPANIVPVEPDPFILMAQLIGQARLKASLSQKAMAEKMGFKALSQYQKLGKETLPSTRSSS